MESGAQEDFRYPDWYPPRESSTRVVKGIES